MTRRNPEVEFPERTTRLQKSSTRTLELPRRAANRHAVVVEEPYEHRPGSGQNAESFAADVLTTAVLSRLDKVFNQLVSLSNQIATLKTNKVN